MLLQQAQLPTEQAEAAHKLAYSIAENCVIKKMVSAGQVWFKAYFKSFHFHLRKVSH